MGSHPISGPRARLPPQPSQDQAPRAALTAGIATQGIRVQLADSLQPHTGTLSLLFFSVRAQSSEVEVPRALPSPVEVTGAGVTGRAARV